MPHNVTGSNTFTNPIPAYSDGDPVAQALNDPTVQALANRDTNLTTRLATLESQNLNSRIATLEGQNLNSRIAALEAQSKGILQAWSVWNFTPGPAATLVDQYHMQTTHNYFGSPPTVFQCYTTGYTVTPTFLGAVCQFKALTGANGMFANADWQAINAFNCALFVNTVTGGIDLSGITGIFTIAVFGY